MTDEQINRRPRPASVEEFLNQAVAEKLGSHTPRNENQTKKQIQKKLKAFNLPIDLIQKIEEEAEAMTAGNASALAVRIFQAHFRRQEDIDNCRYL